jgi:hypothetical protein
MPNAPSLMRWGKTRQTWQSGCLRSGSQPGAQGTHAVAKYEGGIAMIKNLDTSELQRLKGIGIGVTDDEQPFLIITYQKRRMSEKALTCVYWSVTGALFGMAGWLLWWAAMQ